jgi:hypothetical protein
VLTARIVCVAVAGVLNSSPGVATAHFGDGVNGDVHHTITEIRNSYLKCPPSQSGIQRFFRELQTCPEAHASFSAPLFRMPFAGFICGHPARQSFMHCR